MLNPKLRTKHIYTTILTFRIIPHDPNFFKQNFAGKQKFCHNPKDGNAALGL